MMVKAGEKLARLRDLLRGCNFAAYVVPSGDAHNSEYTSRRDARREFVSGFTGSAGTAVVTLDQAKLWTDGRYFVQAAKELDPAEWSLMKDRLPETPSVEAWLASVLPKGSVVGADPYLFPIGQITRMRTTLESADIRLDVTPHANLVDRIWGEAQPPYSTTPVQVLEDSFAGASPAAKLALVRAELDKRGVGALVVTALDEIAWLLNLRDVGTIPRFPCPISYAIVTAGPDESVLCIPAHKLTPTVTSHLDAAGVTVQPYESVLDVVKAAAQRAQAAGKKVWLDPNYCNYAVYTAVREALSEGATSGSAPATGGASGSSKEGVEAAVTATDGLVVTMSPVQLLKGVKNERERQGFRDCHVRDGAALVRFLAWLELAVKDGVDSRTGGAVAFPLTEHTVSEVLESFRASDSLFVELSFDTIAGMGPNGAIVHYRPDPATAATVTDQGVFLLDSGAHYKDGTTDVTRTLHFGTPTEYQRECFTRVLKGHIAMSAARFPAGTSGIALDHLARSALFQAGLDYNHGTGHGVGYGTAVHEGPFGASPRPSPYTEGIKAGMTLTDEPGYYEEGSFGIRIENVLLAVEANTPYRFGGKTFLEFDPVTLVPITPALIEPSLLTAEDKSWINAYHVRVREALAPILQGDDKATAYLMRETEEIA